jgi:hypothetical protein
MMNTTSDKAFGYNDTAGQPNRFCCIKEQYAETKANLGKGLVCQIGSSSNV